MFIAVVIYFSEKDFVEILSDSVFFFMYIGCCCFFELGNRIFDNEFIVLFFYCYVCFLGFDFLLFCGLYL